ncbi:hypothetical protein PISMIDRAFT_658664 [Pisolithus microcarpus 441]|uniref:DDE-1 domain-containing protein n=1 Tax=Pisolithus microcarpus 441 TaxID=765257 RepID=A0A0C9ZI94_9AGAM|nr:hypothetical protein PISMIDRAFT_658664 [Pisolithus microcarpus 441]
MPSRAKSQTKKKQIKSQYQEEALAQAIELYREEQKNPSDKQKGLRIICQEVEMKWKGKNQYVKVDKETVWRQLQGGRSWFPLNHWSLKVHNLESGVGKNWTDQFIECHSSQLHQFWSSSLDTARGHAVNKNTNKEWYDLLGNTIDKFKIDADCLWAADETGFQPGNGVKECVFGPAKAKIQYQQHNGNRKNITVMVTICADGEDLPPTVIYKGQQFSTVWHQDNTLGASVTHSPKGWTDGVIGRLWIEDFDKKTRTKANGHACLLLVDGHNSHYTKEFSDYARENNIHILCYPAHTTHIYQGLNVVIFRPLKHYWTEERDQYESSKQHKIDKTNFVSIYARAHKKALTPETVRAAFRKTGVWPFNPSVILDEMLAPSFETSAVGRLPLSQPSPVHAVSKKYLMALCCPRSCGDTGLDISIIPSS